MARFLTEKKGVESSGVLVGIVIVLLGLVVILPIVFTSASKASEGSAIKICRTSNEIRVATESNWNPFHSPRICETIYKVDSKLEIPNSKKYSQDAKGAQDEIGDMLKNCWYMWLEGSDKRVFPRGWPWVWTGQYGCHICYVFKIKDGVKPFDFESIIKSLKARTYSAVDSSDGCAPDGSGFIRSSCQADEKEVISKLAPQNRYCCIKKDSMNECENKGGKCDVPTIEGKLPNQAYPYTYDKWLCPSGKVCYVKEENYYSYFKYLTEFGKRGGSLSEPINDKDKFTLTGVNAISIYSGSEDVQDAFLRISSLDYAKGEGKCGLTSP